MGKNLKKEIARKVLDFEQAVDVSKEELLGIEEQLPQGIIKLDEMARYIDMINNNKIIKFSRYNRSPTYIKDMAETRKDANKAFDAFVSAYEDKYPKTVDCLKKDRNKLLAFYDFPAAQWQHIRTTNPIELTFATVRPRTAKTRGCVSRI